MNYQECTEFLYSQLPMYQRVGESAYKADLKRTIQLDKYFNRPHKDYLTIHVGGTNGKGSVSHSIASILQSAGYKVGLYTSPHLLSFTERIKVNGKEISESNVVNFVESNLEIIKEIRPSFFEMTVAMAFDHFKKRKVDIAVIEVGLGGRLDSTNIISPILSVITNIGIDHTQFLGNTYELIAQEKAGIIKENIPIVIGEIHPKTENIFIETAYQKGSKIMFAENFVTLSDTTFENNQISTKAKFLDNNDHLNVCFDLNGTYQISNLKTILSTIKILQEKLKIDETNIIDGLSKVKENTGIRGRWETIKKHPKVILDTGHNFDGISMICKGLEQESYNKLHLILGFVNDKDIKNLLQLFPEDASYYYTQASIPRAMNYIDLQEIGKKFNRNGLAYPNISDTYHQCISSAQKDDLIFIGGSTFIVADFLKLHIKKN